MWFPLALAAAALWGIDYSFSEQVFKHISILTALAVTTIGAAIVLTIVALATDIFQKDVATMVAQPRVFGFLAVAAIAFIAGDLLISASISDYNATVASLVEISYPFFVALFSYLIFKENSLTLPTALGGMLILAGVATIYVFNR